MPSATKRRTAAMGAIRAGLIDLLNDRSITERECLHHLETIVADVAGFIGDLEFRLPELRSRHEEADGGLTWI
jgi:hypothetical protein